MRKISPLRRHGLKIKKEKERNYEKENLEESTCGFTCSGYGNAIIRMRNQRAGEKGR